MNLTPVPSHPDYSITPTGEVYRTVPNNRIPHVPYRMAIRMMGNNGSTPCVGLSKNKVIHSRTINSLLRETFP